MPSLKLRQGIVRTIAYADANGNQQCVHRDEALERFGLRVYPSGQRVYVCSYRVNAPVAAKGKKKSARKPSLAMFDRPMVYRGIKIPRLSIVVTGNHMDRNL